MKKKKKKQEQGKWYLPWLETDSWEMHSTAESNSPGVGEVDRKHAANRLEEFN